MAVTNLGRWAMASCAGIHGVELAKGPGIQAGALMCDMARSPQPIRSEGAQKIQKVLLLFVV
jgi:hypothetical protein